MTLTLSVFFAMLLFITVFGARHILTNFRFDRSLTFEDVEIEKISKLDQAFFDSQDRFAQRFGFSKQLESLIHGYGGEFYIRFYTRTDGTTLTVGVLFPMAGSAQNCLELSTIFEGMRIYTLNLQISEFCPQPPWMKMFIHPGAVDGETLLNLHRQHVADNVKTGTPLAKHGSFYDECQKHHSRYQDYQVERGYYKIGSTGQIVSPTLKMAMRGVINFFNPFADNFTPVNLAKVYLGSMSLIFMGWMCYFSDLGGWIDDPTYSLLARSFLLGLSYMTAGSIIGYVFKAKSFIWSFFVAIPTIAFVSLTILPGDSMEYHYLFFCVMTLRAAAGMYNATSLPDRSRQARWALIENGIIMTTFLSMVWIMA